MTTTGSPVSHADDCARFEAQLGTWLEHDLETSEQGWMTAHRHRCTACASLVDDLEAVITGASTLAALSPPRDLWSGIEARLDAPVLPMPMAAPHIQIPRQRAVTVRWFAIAATLLVAVSSVVTWQIARRGVTDFAGPDHTRTVADIDAPASVGVRSTDPSARTDAPLPATTTQVETGSSIPTSAHRTTVNQVINDDADLLDADVTYEREISALRHIVDERFMELDSSTVTVLRRNLDIIDMAITDSRAALRRDPRSAVVSSQLDRALQAKLSLMRRVALL